MKIIKEHINEKFSEETDPVHDLGIGKEYLLKSWRTAYYDMGRKGVGTLSKEYYGTDKYGEEIYVVYLVLEGVIQQGSIESKDLQYQYEKAINRYYRYSSDEYIDLKKIAECLDKYFHIIINPVKPKRRKVYEKFEEESDPIADLGIGIKKFWEKELKREGGINSIESAIHYYGNEKFTNEAFAVFKVLKHIVNKDIDNQEDIQKIFEDTINDLIIRRGDKIELDKVIYALKKFFYIEVKPFKPKKPYLQEKFSEESDPITDLGIGIEHVIQNKLGKLWQVNKNHFGSYQYAFDIQRHLILFGKEMPHKDALQHITDILKEMGLLEYLIFQPGLTKKVYGYKNTIDNIIYYWKIKDEYFKYFNLK